MRTINIKRLLEWGKSSKSKIAEAVREATEVGVVVPSILRSGLIARGFVIDDDQRKTAAGEEWKFVKQVKILEDGELVAMGTSSDLPDALLHAVLGYANENKA